MIPRPDESERRPILLDGEGIMRALLHALLPKGRDAAALVLPASAWLDDNLAAALAPFGPSSYDPFTLDHAVLPFASAEDALAAVCRWREAGLTRKGTIIDLWTLNSAEARWEPAEYDLLTPGEEDV